MKLTLPGHSWFKTSGRIIYDPDRPGMSRKVKWWVVVPLDNGIANYYRWFINKHNDPLSFNDMRSARKFGYDFVLPPSWGAHVTVIRGENDVRPTFEKVLPLWKKYDGQNVEIEYSNQIKNKGAFWFVEVRSEFLMNIRKEMGLKTTWPLHLTLGRYFSEEPEEFD